MEIKTTEELKNICEDAITLFYSGKGFSSRKMFSVRDKKWVSVESLKEWMIKNSFGYRELGVNCVDQDDLIKELEGGQE